MLLFKVGWLPFINDFMHVPFTKNEIYTGILVFILFNIEFKHKICKLHAAEIKLHTMIGFNDNPELLRNLPQLFQVLSSNQGFTLLSI
jgi:hypothetical protein